MSGTFFQSVYEQVYARDLETAGLTHYVTEAFGPKRPEQLQDCLRTGRRLAAEFRNLTQDFEELQLRWGTRTVTTSMAEFYAAAQQEYAKAEAFAAYCGLFRYFYSTYQRAEGLCQHPPTC